MTDTFRSLGQLSALQIGSIFKILATEFGTLWWVREDLWKQSYPNYKSDRAAHPAVSIRSKTARVDFSYVPMLHGRSEKSAIAILGLSRYHPERPTYFGHILRPAHIGVSEFKAQTNNPNIDQWEDCVGIVVNHHKSRVTEGEEQVLRDWWNAVRARAKRRNEKHGNR